MDGIKKFEDFLDKMQGLLDNAKKQGHIIVRVEDLESTFPELRESKDEKIRKEIVDFINRVYERQALIITDEERDDWVAWLEKQGEQQKFRDSIQVGDKVTRNKDGILVNLSQLNRVAKKDNKQGEQKPAWSEEDEKNFARVDYACLKVYGGDSYSSDWLRKFLGIHKKWKPSDEQMEAFEHFVRSIGESGYDNKTKLLYSLLEQLKKLKEE